MCKSITKPYTKMSRQKSARSSEEKILNLQQKIIIISEPNEHLNIKYEALMLKMRKILSNGVIRNFSIHSHMFQMLFLQWKQYLR